MFFELSRDLHISEALQMQIEVQRRLNEQLEVLPQLLINWNCFLRNVKLYIVILFFSKLIYSTYQLIYNLIICSMR